MMDYQKKWGWVIGVAAKASGIEEDEITTNGRGAWKASQARLAVCWFLLDQGQKTRVIGTLIGCDHSNVSHYKKSMESREPGEVTLAVRAALDAALAESKARAADRAEAIERAEQAAAAMAPIVRPLRPAVDMGDFGVFYGRRSASGAASMHLKSREGNRQ